MAITPTRNFLAVLTNKYKLTYVYILLSVTMKGTPFYVTLGFKMAWFHSSSL
jgi:hypothetical protein